MNLFEEALIYSTVLHSGMKRKIKNTPYILHPMEVAQIISTITDDIEVLTAGVLHDVVEDTDGTISEIKKRFGDRVAELVSSETENKAYDWRKRKEDSIAVLAQSNDVGVKILWLADKLSNIRSIARDLSENGNSVWDNFHQKDPEMHKWYYKTIAEQIEMDLNRTGAFKEYIRHINEIWPGTFADEKTRYRKFKEISLEGCKLIGKGAKGSVYRYNEEVIVKVYNNLNTFKDIERENYLARTAFIAGIPTAISFGIVSVNDKYGSMFELLNSRCVSELVASNLNNLDYFAKQMAQLALTIHSTSGEGLNLPDFTAEALEWVNGGIANEDPELSEKITRMILDIPKTSTMIHGDFHSGNVMVQKDEFLLIDMDRLSTAHPVLELCGVYMAYIGFGEINPSMVENFLGFSYEKSKEFFRLFMENYLNSKDEDFNRKITDKAALLCYLRLVRRCYKKGTNLREDDAKARDYYMKKIRELIKTTDTLYW